MAKITFQFDFALRNHLSRIGEEEIVMNFRAAAQIQLSVNDGPKFRFSRHFLAFAGAAGTPAAIGRGIFRRICFKERFVLGGSEMPSHTLIGGRIVRR